MGRPLIPKPRIFQQLRISRQRLYTFGETEREEGDGAKSFIMSYRYKKPFRYRLTNPPKALLKARMDNIAIIPASLLGMKALWQTTANTLPEGGVLLCHTQQNPRQRRLLERVGEAFRQQGHELTNPPIEQVTDH
jgi:hypothetical protein